MKLGEIFDDQGFFQTPFESHQELVRWRDRLKSVLDSWRKSDNDAAIQTMKIQAAVMAGETIELTGTTGPFQPGHGYAAEIEELL